MKYFIKKYYYEIVASVTCVAIGMLTSLVVKDNMYPWYTDLIKPSFNPPSWIFAPVWTFLYVLMGITFARLLKNFSKYKIESVIFSLQYLYNIVWSSLFFYYHRIDLALYDVLLMLILMIIFVMRVKKDKTLALLSLPYIVWISFAALLNYQIYLLN